MAPNGSENFLTPLLLQMAGKRFFKLVLNCPSSFSHKTTFGIFEILNFLFLTLFFVENFKQLYPNNCTLCTNQKAQLSEKGAILERGEIWDLRVVVQYI